MRSFLQGFVVVVGGVYLFALYAQICADELSGLGALRLALVLVIAPTLSALGAAATVHRLSRRRVLQEGIVGGAIPTIYGMLSAVGMIASVAFLLILWGSIIPEVALTVASSAVMTCVMLTVLARRQLPGLCSCCGYDIHASLDVGRCPECGSGF